MTPSAIGQRTGISTRLRRRFAAPREQVFRAWTDPEILKKWWCPPGWTPTSIHVDPRSGGTYRIGMRKSGSSLLVCVHGRFLEVCAPERLVFTWRWENAFEGMPETRVTVQFFESAGDTEIVLLHEGLPEAGVCLRHRAGWIEAWARLEKYCFNEPRATPGRSASTDRP